MATNQSSELEAMVAVLESHGDTYAGNHADETAQDWLDNDFDSAGADEWCEIGVWDAATAATFRDAGRSPAEIASAADRLIDAAGEDVAETYTDGSPIYAACNRDLSPQKIIDACD